MSMQRSNTLPITAIEKGATSKALHIDSYEEIQHKIKKAFDAVDIDGSGLIDVKEFALFAGPILDIPSDRLDFHFKAIDADNTGKISVEEFLAHIQNMSNAESEEYLRNIQALSPIVSSKAILESLYEKQNGKHAKSAHMKMVANASLLIVCSAVVPLLMYWSQVDGRYEYNIPMFFLWRNLICSIVSGMGYAILFRASPFTAWTAHTILCLVPVSLLLVIADISSAYSLEYISVDSMVGLKYSKMVFLCIFTILYYRKIPRKDVLLTIFTFVCLIIVYISLGSGDGDSLGGYVLVLLSAGFNVLAGFLHFLIFGKKLKSLHLLEGLCMNTFVASIVVIVCTPFISGGSASEYIPFKNWNFKCWLLLAFSTIQCFSIFALLSMSPEVKLVAKYLGKTSAIALSYAFFGGFEVVKFTLTLIFALNAFIYSMEINCANQMKDMEAMISEFTTYDQALMELAKESPNMLQKYIKYKSIDSSGAENQV